MVIAKERTFTYGDIINWEDDNRFGLFEGAPRLLASASPEHQDISLQLGTEMNLLLRPTRCKVYQASDVRPFQTSADDTEDQKNVVRPDLAVVCDKSNVDDHGIMGPPNLVVEILSNSTRRADLVEKFKKYAKAGIPTYWIVDSKTQTVSVFTLENGQYHAPTVYTKNLSLPFPIAAEDAAIDLKVVFPV